MTSNQIQHKLNYKCQRNDERERQSTNFYENDKMQNIISCIYGKC